MDANYSVCVKGWRFPPVTHQSSSQTANTNHCQMSGWLASWLAVHARHVNEQTPDWSCVSGLLFCCRRHCCPFWNPRNFVLFRLWNPLVLLRLLFFPLLFQNHYWTVLPPALGALWRQSAATGDHPSNYPAEEPEVRWGMPEESLRKPLTHETDVQQVRWLCYQSIICNK